MQAIGFYLFYGINWIMTLLPLPVLYIFSDFLYLIMYYFPGYRRKVVRTNLINSFPEKSEKEIKIIEKKFYHHICDLFIETLKLVHLSNRQLMKRVTPSNPELLNRLYEEGRDVVAVLGHIGNWEWMIILPFYTRLQNVSIYKPLENKYFDRFMNKLRTRNKTIISPMAGIAREIINLRNNNIRALYAFIIDQSPPKNELKYWTRFLNQDTPVYLGAEKIASKYDMAVVFYNIKKLRRGYYSFTTELLFEHSTGLPEYAITEAHVRRLEEIIRERPEEWMWSHRRWKHKREASHD
ncbi:MAG: lysophospholipid acyltransferase family protein [Bacteroidales bacterium]|jgi:KDO2-lipid IV(A) lauroyltransferase